jgi:4-hydroxybenzoate polyprenyltransferase
VTTLQAEKLNTEKAASVGDIRAEQSGFEKLERGSRKSLALLIVRQMRWKQWTKNLLCYAPLLFSGKFYDLAALSAATQCFLSFCMISSGIYVLNDVMDVKADRLHPVKRFRPIASGLLNIQLALLIGCMLVGGGLLTAYSVRHSLALVGFGYIVLNVCYSLGLKNFAILDILCIASGFVFRAIAGAVAISVLPSSWFLLCTSLGALFLAMEKRRNELAVLLHDSTMHRKALGDYSLSLIKRFESLVVPSLLTSYAFYTFQSPHGQWMMMTIPAVLYGIMRYQLLSERGTNTGTPEEVLLKDKPIQLTILVWLVISSFVVYAHPREIVHSISEGFDSFRIIR